jgi:hypothetical protein
MGYLLEKGDAGLVLLKVSRYSSAYMLGVLESVLVVTAGNTMIIYLQDEYSGCRSRTLPPPRGDTWEPTRNLGEVPWPQCCHDGTASNC